MFLSKKSIKFCLTFASLFTTCIYAEQAYINCTNPNDTSEQQLATNASGDYYQAQGEWKAGAYKYAGNRLGDVYDAFEYFLTSENEIAAIHNSCPTGYLLQPQKAQSHANQYHVLAYTTNGIIVNYQKGYLTLQPYTFISGHSRVSKTIFLADEIQKVLGIIEQEK